MLKENAALIIYIVTALAIVVTALIAKGSKYENAWFIILAVGSILAGFAETYSRKKDK